MTCSPQDTRDDVPVFEKDHVKATLSTLRSKPSMATGSEMVMNSVAGMVNIEPFFRNLEKEFYAILSVTI